MRSDVLGDLDLVLTAGGASPDRDAISLAVLAVVSAWAGEGDDIVEDVLAGKVAADPGKPVHEAAERRIRYLALEAESNTRPWRGHPSQVVTIALADLSIVDDYLRIKGGTQSMAFAFDWTPEVPA